MEITHEAKTKIAVNFSTLLQILHLAGEHLRKEEWKQAVGVLMHARTLTEQLAFAADLADLIKHAKGADTSIVVVKQGRLFTPCE